MKPKSNVKVVVGLGNPGQSYETTRHNLGYMVVRSFGSNMSAAFKSKASFKGKIAKLVFENNRSACLLLPETFMNLSGLSVRACLQKLGIELENLLIVSDDIQIPFGTMRFRQRGSHGGHNGLKSIESCLGTRDYQRLRLGVSAPVRTDLSEYVLQDFNEVQFSSLDGILKNAHVVLDYWLNDKQELAKQFANQTKSLDQGEDHEENP